MIQEIKDVLIFSRQTALEFELQKKGFGRTEHIEQLDCKREEHEAHYRGLETIVSLFENEGITPVVRERENLDVSDYEKRWSVMIPYGGDRTFMKIASLIKDDTLLMGIKSKEGSYGAHYNTVLSDAPEHIRRLVHNEGVGVERRARIEGASRAAGFSCELAANDLFLGKRYGMSFSRTTVEKGGCRNGYGSNGILVSTYAGATAWYNNVLTRNQNSLDQEIARQALAESGLDSDHIVITEPRAAFKPRDKHMLRYKSINTKESDGQDFGIIREDESILIIPDGSGYVVSFDGIEPGVEWPRCFDVPAGQPVSVKLSDKYLHVADFPK